MSTESSTEKQNESIYIEFSLELGDNQWLYSSEKKGEAKFTAKLPRFILESLDISQVLNGLLQVALEEYDRLPDRDAGKEGELAC